MLVQAAYEYLADTIFHYAEHQNCCIFPLNTTGDGSCLLHAVSRGVYGMELFSDILRQGVASELEDNEEWYAAPSGLVAGSVCHSSCVSS